ncbi:hypothetical protein Dsin_012856 [Dipteronia sinensis]|uniref:Cyclic nucleotide-binding domain-containing protein n=1 Tax=Dipteronia sinensis TaxID=43782 RepID=A0AAE0E8F5_9ROSI|nr:hypothetical protein Dsin_012856 [Dipteronia sinensis]
MQNLIKSAMDERRKKEDQAIDERRKKEDQAQNCIKKYHQYNSQQIGGVDVENLFHNVAADVINNIKHELYLEQIKKVKRFRRWSDASLRHLCDCIKPRVYAELTCIVREGDPIDEMLFVLHGKLWNSSSAASSMNNISPRDRRKEILKDGDFWGEELVNWVQDKSSSSSSSEKLISQSTIKALTKVEAFVLSNDDLKKLFDEKAKIIQSWFHTGMKRDPWKVLLITIMSDREQITPPGDQLTGPEIIV